MEACLQQLSCCLARERWSWPASLLPSARPGLPQGPEGRGASAPGCCFSKHGAYRKFWQRRQLKPCLLISGILSHLVLEDSWVRPLMS